MRYINNLSEKDVARIWQYQLLDVERLVTEEGEPLEIIYPGRLNDDRGPDFRGAVILAGSGLIRGDIEVHVRSGFWLEHGHHLDAAYNRVILHVVMWHGSGMRAQLQNGGQAPTLALSKYINIPLSRWSGLDSFSDGANLSRPCADRLSPEALAGFLDGAGEERFHMKAAGFQRDLAQMEAGQSLYKGIMGALGYSRNNLPFLELARRVPLYLLESMTDDKITDAEWLLRRQSLLLGTSGLLDIQVAGGCLRNILGENRTGNLLKLLGSSCFGTIPSCDWHLLKIRPNNSPIRRLLAMSYLLLRYREEGLLNGLVSLVREAAPGRGGRKSLEAGLVVNSDDCQTSSSGCCSGSRIGNLTLLGRGRAADISVNVLLPFTLAWSQSTSQTELGGKALGLYRLYPRVTVNSVERHMTEQLGLDSSLVNNSRLVNSACRLVNSASRQQGLIHIYKNLCSQGRCGRCPLGHL